MSRRRLAWGAAGVALAWAGALAAAAADGGRSPRARPGDEPAAPPPASPAAIQAAVEDGLYEVAQRQAETALAAARERGDAPAAATNAVLLMRALHGLGRHADALKVADGAKAACAGAGCEDAWLYWRAAASHAIGDPPAAVALATELRRRFPESALARDALRLMAAAHTAAGSHAEALDCYELYDRESGQAAGAALNLLEWGQALAAGGRTGEARVVLERLAALASNRLEVQEGQCRLGELLAAEGRWTNAATCLRAVLGNESAPADLQARAGLALATVLRGQGSTDEAAAALKQASERARSDALKREAGIRLGNLLIAAGRIEEGVSTLKAVIAQAPADPLSEAAQLDLAQGLLDRQRAEDAAREFQFYVETYTNQAGRARAHEGRGWALLALRRYAEAAGAFVKACDLQAEPEARARCLFKAGDAHLANSQYGMAADLYARLLSEFPGARQSMQARYQLAEAKAQGGSPSEAELLLQELIAQTEQPELAERARLRLAYLKEAAERWDDAIAVYDAFLAACTNSPYVPDALLGRALVRYRRFEFREALGDLDRIGRDHAAGAAAEQAAFYRTLCRYWLGQDEEALALARAFLEAHPASTLTPSMMFWLGRLLFNRGDFPAAERMLARFVEQYPQDSKADDALMWAGLSAEQQKEYLRAVELLNRLVKEHPESDRLAEARFAQADALSHLSRYPEAILILDDIIARHPDSDVVAAAWGRKGDCQFTLGTDEPKRYEESIASYRAAIAAAEGALDLVLQAEYKIGRCHEKAGRTADALDQYYARVVGRYLAERQKAGWLSEASKVWFTRAAFGAADILEARKDWRGLVRVLERVVEAEVPASADAAARIARVKSERWWIW